MRTDRVARLTLVAAFATFAGACAPAAPASGDDVASAGAAASEIAAAAVDGEAASPPPSAPHRVVDSIFPPAEQVRRFRAGLEPTTTLAGGSASIEALARRFLLALERSDTADIRAMAVTRAEFAYLYYPGSVFAGPDRHEDPRIAWFLIRQNSEVGIRRALRRLGGHRLDLTALRCGDTARKGRLRVTENCFVTFTRDGGAPESLRLFGSVLELDGRHKLLSYANDF